MRSMQQAVINGYQIEFQFQDDEHDAEKSVNAYNTLKDWGMQVLVGTTTSAPCLAVADKTAADNMFQITPSVPLWNVQRIRTYSVSATLTRIRVRLLLLSIGERISLPCKLR